MAEPAPARRLGSVPLGRIGGIDARLDPSAILILGLMGWGVGDGSLSTLAIWIGVALLAILVHELGHAVAFRACGHRAHVLLYGMGGLTSSGGGPPLRPLQDLAVDLAGPLAGFGLGALAWFLLPGTGAWADPKLFLLIATFLWGALNLLPIHPLDGGQALGAVLRLLRVRSAEQRVRQVTVVVAGGLAVLAFRYVSSFTAFFLALFAFQALAELRRLREEPLVDQLREGYEAVLLGEHARARRVAEGVLLGPDGRPTGVGGSVAAVAGDLAVWAALGEGDVVGAREALTRRGPVPVPQGERRPRLVEAAVALAEHAVAPPEVQASLGVDGTLALLAESLDAGEWGPPNILAHLLETVPDGAARVVAACGPDGLARLQELAHRGGAWALSTAAGEALLARRPDPIVAANLACTRARAGDAEGAVRWLRVAKANGAPLAELLADDDLATVRGRREVLELL